MIDINIIRNNKEKVITNLKKKYQEEKIPLVDKILTSDKKLRDIKVTADELRMNRNKISDAIGQDMRNKDIKSAEKKKEEVKNINEQLSTLEKEEETLNSNIKEMMMKIPNIIDESVPIGPDEDCNVELEKFGDPTIPDYEIPYHADILESFNGLDKVSSGRTSGNGFYYLMGDAARLSSAMLSYARDYMIDKNFIYCIPPFMIRSDVVTGVMSFEEMDAMMYKIEGEDLYLIGTSEHSMIGKFKGQIIKEKELPITMTSYSPCFRKEVGAHGIEERGIYRVHQS